MLNVKFPEEGKRAPLLKVYPGRLEPQNAYLELTEEGEVYFVVNPDGRTTVPERVFNGRSLWFGVTPYMSRELICDVLSDEFLISLLEDIYTAKQKSLSIEDKIKIEDKINNVDRYLDDIEPDVSGPFSLEYILKDEDPSDIQEELRRIWGNDPDAYASFIIDNLWRENKFIVEGDGQDIINYIKEQQC